MTAPVGLVGAALFLWGVSIRLPWLGAAAAVCFEALRLAPRSAASARAGLVGPVIRVCALLALAFLGYVIATRALPQSLYTWLRWLPLALFPVAALQPLAGGIPLARAMQALGFRSQPDNAGDELDLTHPYAALTLAAAGTGNGAQPWLYAGCALIVGWALLARLGRTRRAVAASLFLLAAAIGYAAQLGIYSLQGHVEDLSTEFFADLFAPKADPFRERTRIGDLGKVKLSDRILMRVVPEGRRPASLLLRESAFDRYRNGEWQSARHTSRPAAKEGDQWRISPGPATSRLQVRRSLPGGEGLLPLPLGTRTVAGLPARSMEVYPSGAVRVHDTPRFLAIEVAYDESAEREAPDTTTDLEVPEVLAGTLARVLAEHRLLRASPAETLEAVQAFFDTNFSYSLNLGGGGEQARGRTLADFLLRERKGHCEYFATATVLLLRQAGIPARYVGGFSAQEYSPLEKAFVVRARHAHAWAVVHFDGRWINSDTTPARWAELEGEEARGIFAPLLDRLSWLFDRLVRAWMEGPSLDLVSAGTVAGGTLLLIGALWIGMRRLRARATRRPAATTDPIVAAWRQVENAIAAAGHPRGVRETPRAWARRLRTDAPAESWRGKLVELADAYYRARFDPNAEPGDARAFLARCLEAEVMPAGAARRGA